MGRIAGLGHVSGKFGNAERDGGRVAILGRGGLHRWLCAFAVPARCRSRARLDSALAALDGQAETETAAKRRLDALGGSQGSQ